MMMPIELPEDVILPESILPVQFNGLWRGSAKLTPERSLLLAVLEQAASDLQNFRFRRRRRAQRLYWDAYEWVMSSDRSHPFSFVNICEGLKLAPEALRAGMLSTGLEHLTKAA